MLSRIRHWQRRRLAQSFEVDAATWQAVESRLPFLEYLPPTERQRLRQLTLELLAEKEFAGAHGLTVTTAMRLGIGLQAALLVLHLGLEAYRGWVGIVVYPGDFVIPRTLVDEDGVTHEFDDAVLGEAWDGGPVLVSWPDDPEELDGINVVIHEFAHKLDMGNGAVDGVPALPPHIPGARWSGAFRAAYEDFCQRVDADEETALDPYGAEHPSEFFAVMSEAFFETPLLLQAEYPEVYACLRDYYQQDPALRAGEIQSAPT